MELNNAKQWYTKKWVWGIAILIVIAILYAMASSNGEISYKTESVRRIDIEQIVSVTGKVNADPKINLNFETSGMIDKVYFEVGDEVKEGEVIAEIENFRQSIDVDRARAELKAAEAALEQRFAGSTDEEINVARTVVKQAKNNINLVEVDLENTERIADQNIKQAELKKEEAEIALEESKISLENVKITTEQAIRTAEKDLDSASVNLNKAEVEFNNTLLSTDKSIKDAYEDMYPAMNESLISLNKSITESDNILGIDNKSANDEFDELLGVLDSSIEPLAQKAYYKSRDSYQEARQSFDVLQKGNSAGVEETYNTVLSALEDGDNLLDKIADLLENTITSTRLTEKELNAKKENINNIRNILSVSKDALTNRYQTLTSSLLDTETSDEQARASYEVSKNNYTVALHNLDKTKKEGASNIKIAEAKVKAAKNVLAQAERNLSLVKTEYSNTINQIQAQKALKETNLENSEANLNLVLAGPREVDVKSLRANVEQAEANLESAQYELTKAQIISPANGIVSKIEIEEGETYLGASSVDKTLAAVVIIATTLKVDADISETDIAKLEINDPVTMTLDAFTKSEKFFGKVIKIDPAETIISGVVYYKVETVFELQYEGIKPGMTTNLDILTDKKENVLAIPIRSIIFKEDKNFVRQSEKGKMVEKEVVLGLEGDLYVEVLDGLNEDDEVIVSINNN